MDDLLAAGVRPREEAFLSELKGAAKTKSWEDALKLLDGLFEAGYQPRPGAYACAIRYVINFCRRGMRGGCLVCPALYRPILSALFFCLECVGHNHLAWLSAQRSQMK